MNVRADITGIRSGRLIALHFTRINQNQKRLWLCQCDCGKQAEVIGSRIANGRTASCGCLHSETAAQNGKDAAAKIGASRITHGASRHRSVGTTKEYMIWATMKQRCNNPHSQKFKDYGGRGISVCSRWDAFENFLADMGLKPSATHSIDRIDNDGNYEPSNCRWTTQDVQVANQRRRETSRWIEHNGARHTLTEWAQITGIKLPTLHWRLSNGWQADRALTA